MRAVLVLALFSLVAALSSAGRSYYRCIPMVALMAAPCCVHGDSAVVDTDGAPAIDDDDVGCCERETFASVAPTSQLTSLSLLVPQLALIGFAGFDTPNDRHVASLDLARARAPMRHIAQPRAPPIGPERSRLMVFLL